MISFQMNERLDTSHLFNQKLFNHSENKSPEGNSISSNQTQNMYSLGLPKTSNNNLIESSEKYLLSLLLPVLKPRTRHLSISPNESRCDIFLKGMYWKHSKQKWVAEWNSFSKGVRVWKTFSVSRYGYQKAKQQAAKARIEAELKGDTISNPYPLVQEDKVSQEAIKLLLQFKLNDINAKELADDLSKIENSGPQNQQPNSLHSTQRHIEHNNDFLSQSPGYFTNFSNTNNLSDSDSLENSIELDTSPTESLDDISSSNNGNNSHTIQNYFFGEKYHSKFQLNSSDSNEVEQISNSHSDSNFLEAHSSKNLKSHENDDILGSKISQKRKDLIIQLPKSDQHATCLQEPSECSLALHPSNLINSIQHYDISENNFLQAKKHLLHFDDLLDKSITSKRICNVMTEDSAKQDTDVVEPRDEFSNIHILADMISFVSSTLFDYHAELPFFITAIKLQFQNGVYPNETHFVNSVIELTKCIRLLSPQSIHLLESNGFNNAKMMPSNEGMV